MVKTRIIQVSMVATFPHHNLNQRILIATHNQVMDSSLVDISNLDINSLDISRDHMERLLALRVL
jgi:hypothetical protein